MIEELQELEHLANASRNKKGRMDSESRSKATELLVRIWLDYPDQAVDTIRYFEDLQSEAVAEAVGKLWPRLSEAGRIQLDRSIPKPNSERSIRRLSLFIAEVINNDAEIALRWLQLLLPREKDYPAKDVRQNIVTSLLISGQVTYAFKATYDEQAWEVARIYKLLWDIGKESSTNIPSISRAKLAVGIARHITTHPFLRHKQSRLLEDAERESIAWSKELKEMWEKEHSAASSKGSVPPLAPTTAGRIGSEEDQPTHLPESNSSHTATEQLTTPRGAQHQQQTPDTLAPNEPISHGNALASLDHAIAREVEKLAMLNGIRTSFETLTTELARVTASEGEKAVELKRARDAANHSALEAEQIKKEIERQRSSFTVQIASLEEQADRDKSLLSQQVRTNAEGRIEEYRNRLGSSLTKLIIDLPSKDAPMSSELGEAVLLLFHQFIEAIQNADVPIAINRGRR